MDGALVHFPDGHSEVAQINGAPEIGQELKGLIRPAGLSRIGSGSGRAGRENARHEVWVERRDDELDEPPAQELPHLRAPHDGGG